MNWQDLQNLALDLAAKIDWILLFRMLFFWVVPPALFVAYSYYRLSRGDSDDISWQANIFRPAENGTYVLQLRDAAPESTIKRVFDAPAMRHMTERLRKQTRLQSPILQTEGDLGWEIINKLMKLLGGSLAGSSLKREKWLFVVTCEDQGFVKKRSIRCFLIRPEDLERMSDFEWVQQHMLLERRLHAARLIALHQIAKTWAEERSARSDNTSHAKNLIRSGVGHARIWTVSLPICTDEPLLDGPHPVDWQQVSSDLRKLGLKLGETR